MTTNIFKSIASKKRNFYEYIEKAQNFNWINQEEFEAINSKLKNDVLTIGVIGQMKCGKSTLLNALVFGEEVLPAATTPMTASLTIITYGEQKKLEAEFFSANEWEELKFLSKRSLDEEELELNLKTKIKAAKEIVEKSYAIKAEIGNLLGSTKEDHFDKLIDYVGADGKYIAITKSVKIFMPFEYLKGVEIVDTPGFNDPIVSREERTKEFLAKADAVIMLLFAGRAFDAVDKDIIFNQLRTVGIGKLLIGVNKYDVCIKNESEAEIISNVKNLLELAGKEYYNNSIADLVREKDPLLLSANMALMSKMNLEYISNDENWNFYYKQASNIFDINSQKEMSEKSLFPEFEKALMETIFDSKDDILLKKPINFIKQKGEKKQLDIINNLTQSQNNLMVLNKPDNDIEELIRNTKRAEKKINRKVNNFEIDVEEILSNGTKNLTRKTEDFILKYKKTCQQIIDDNGVVIKEDNLNRKLISKIVDLEFDLKDLFESFNNNINFAIKKEIENFLRAIDIIAEEYDEDFEMQDYITSCKKEFSKDILNLQFNDLIPSDESVNKEDNFLDTVLDYSSAIIDGATFGILFGTINTTSNVTSGKNNAHERIDNFYSLLDLKIIEQEIKKNGFPIIEKVRRKFTDDFLTPIIEQLEEVSKNKANRDGKILETKNRLAELQNDKMKIEEELMEMEVMI